MINNFKNNSNKEFPFLKESKLLLTVSGGIDSVILTHLMYQLDFDIAIAHVNFRLRGIDSDHDEQFVQQLASTLKIPFYVTHFNTKQYSKQHKLSTQEAARNLRYQWFEEIRKKNNFDYILTAHNLNDSLETFLINLSRGTGLKGLTGIKPINNKIIRPLSSFSRKEITDFALSKNISWREDKSNASTKYTRNKIRHQVIPVLQELNPNLLQSFKQTLENLNGTEKIVASHIKAVLKNVEDKNTNNHYSKISIQKLKKLSNLKAYIFEIFSPYGFSNPKEIVELLEAQSGKQLFSKSFRLVKDRDYLLLEKLENFNEQHTNTASYLINKDDVSYNNEQLSLNIQHFKSDFIKEILGNQKTAIFDKSLLKFPLTVRKWQNGDYFYPKGMQGKKKLSKFFKDKKLSIIDKKNIWLLLSDNKIIWVIGKRQDNRFKITKATTEVTKIEIIS